MMERFDFSKQSLPPGWAFEPPKGGGELAVTGEGVELVKGGRFHGPWWDCPADQHRKWYRMRFTSRTRGTGYYLATFRDADGAELASSLYGGVERSDAWLKQTGCFFGRWGGVTWSMGICCDGPCALKDMLVEVVDAETVAQWGDALRRDVPAVAYAPPADRCARLPETMRRLRGGDRLRIVMLGDSLTHDTACSNFDTLLLRHYPKARVDIVLSVRGSTGCWYYREPEHFQRDVAGLHPDLLVIGVNPGHEKIDALRDVAEHARGDLGCEVAFLAVPFSLDWRDAGAAASGEPLPASEWPGVPLLGPLKELARDLDVECIDLTEPWHRYLGASRKPFQWFNRDRFHGNNRGMQVVAKMLERYFVA